MDVAAASISAVTAGGLVLDIAGALLLALGLMFKKPVDIIDEATSAYGGFNFPLETSLAYQTADAKAGGLLLVSGFVVQLSAAFGWREPTWPDAGYAMAAAGLVDAIVALGLVRWWRPLHLRTMLELRLETLDYDVWTAAISAYGARLGQPLPRNIGVNLTYEDYLRLLLGRRRWERFSADRQLPDVFTKLRRDLPGTTEYEAEHLGE